MPKIVLLINYYSKFDETLQCSRVRFLRLRSRLQSGQRSKSCLSDNSKTTEANLTKFLRKRENNVKVCCAKGLGSCTQGQGNNQVRVITKIYSSKFKETSPKDKA